MADSGVTFKGTVNGLTIVMREEEDIDGICAQIEQKIASAGKFFKGATLAVKYRGKKLAPEDESKILELLSGKSGAKILSFIEDNTEPAAPHNTAGTQTQRKMRMKSFFFKGIEEGITKFYRGTVRSGQSVNFEGNVVVIGDVNPGGEVVASGNVIVMGSLRGIVHAGADGNKEAVVVAFNLQPTQLRISDVITRPPDEKVARGQQVPELAYVKDDMVYIEAYLPQYK